MEKIKEQIMDNKPAATRPSTTEPEDLHIPEREQPSMPEAADKPERPAKDRVADLAASTPTAAGGKVAPRAANAPAGETEPEDLHVPEHEPPSMPEAADKPDKVAKDTSIGELR
jgi:hypothetical protein